jgi:D-inositol-3-phosphate glycosyltransferase
MPRLAVLSMHTSPLAQPGEGDGGGMNVFVRQLSTALARSGAECDVFTRAWSSSLHATVTVEPGLRVHHVPAGPLAPMAKEDLPGVVEEFTDGVLCLLTNGKGPFTGQGADAVHANYWLSGVAGHSVKHELGIPLLSSFHTLAKVKASGAREAPGQDGLRTAKEHEVIECSDVVIASCATEADQIAGLYGADPSRIEVVAPGVDTAFFGPGHRPQARRALGLPADAPMLLFVGRIQPLKAADVAIRALRHLEGHPESFLVLIGGPSGPSGEAEMARLRSLVADLGLGGRVRFVPPRPHELLSTYYRAADACLVPSRSESFGLVALEAAACGVPVVASAVGGLSTLVQHGRTGFLLADRDPRAFAACTEEILRDASLAAEMGRAAAAAASGYTWQAAAGRVLSIWEALSDRRLVECA